jgi:hypothetical protein
MMAHSGADADQDLGLRRSELSVVTCNGYHVLPRLETLLRLCSAHDVVNVQEAYIRQHEMSAARALALALGWTMHAGLVAHERGTYVVTFVKKALHATTVDTVRMEAFAEIELDRFVVVQVSRPRLFIANFYGHATDRQRRHASTIAAVGWLRWTGVPFIIMGDWNDVQEEGAVAEIIANGMAHPMDHIAGGPTRPDGRRRIDFGLFAAELVVSRMFQMQGVSDHDLVGYTVTLQTGHPPYSAEVPRVVVDGSDRGGVI